MYKMGVPPCHHATTRPCDSRCCRADGTVPANDQGQGRQRGNLRNGVCGLQTNWHTPAFMCACLWLSCMKAAMLLPSMWVIRAGGPRPHTRIWVWVPQVPLLGPGKPRTQTSRLPQTVVHNKCHFRTAPDVIYLLSYGREHVGRKESDPLCDRNGWSEPASRLLHASML